MKKNSLPSALIEALEISLKGKQCELKCAPAGERPAAVNQIV